MIREATVFDFPRIYELGCLVNDNFRKVNNLNEMLEDKLTKIIVYEKESVVGFIIATDLGETCDILTIVVDPDFRKQKIATNLLNYLIGELSPYLKLITLEVATKNLPAISLYEKFGFEKVNIRKAYYRDDDAYLMARRMDQE